VILELIRRDPASRMLGRGLLVGAAAGAYAGVYFESDLSGGGLAAAPTPLRILFTLNLCLVLGLPMALFGQLHRRALPFQLSLPLSPRQLSLSRTLAAAGLFLLPGLLSAAVYGAIRGDFATEGLQMYLRFLVVLGIAPFLFQLRPTPGERADLPAPWLHWLRCLALLFGAECWVAVATPPLWLTALAAAAAMALLASLNQRALPASFELASSLGQGPRRGLALPASLGWLRRIPVVSPFAPLNGWMRPDLLLWLNLFAVVAGVLNMVVMSVRLGNWYALFTFPMFQTIFLVFLVYGLPRVAHLPISRRRLFLQGAGQGFLLAALALILALLGAGDPPSVAEVLGSTSAALATAAWFLTWFLLVSAAFHWFLSYPPTRRGRALSWVTRPLHSLAALVPLVWATSLFEAEHPRAVATQAAFQDLGSRLGSPALAWAAAAALAVACYLAAEAIFTRIQVTKLRDRLVIPKK